MATDPDGANGSAIIKATLAGIYLAVAFASGGAVPSITVGAAAIGAGLTLLQQHLERIRTARTEKDQQAAMDALGGLVQQGFELQEHYDHDLAVFLRGDIETLSHQVDGWLATLSNELADVDAAIGAVREQSDTIAQAMSTLASLVEGDRHLAVTGPLGFRRLDRQLFISGGDDVAKKTRLTPTLFRPDGPNWTDFMHGVPFRRQEVDEVTEHLTDEQHDKRIVVLEGESASGKSVVACYAGYLLMARGRPVYHADFNDLCQGDGLDLSNISVFFEQLDRGIRQAQKSFAEEQAGERPQPASAPRPVFIVEDLHRESHEAAVRFIGVLNEHAPDGADFILVTRPASQDKPDGEGQWSIWEHSEPRSHHTRAWQLGEAAVYDNIVGQLSAHIWRKRWELDGVDVPFELNRHHISRIAGEASRSLWLMTWILAGHDGDPSHAFDKRLAIDRARQYLCETAQRAGIDNLERRLPGKPVICALILAVSVFSRWEVPVDRYLVGEILLAGELWVDQQALLDVFESLVATSELLSDADGAVRLPHSALADVYLQAEEDTDVAKYAHSLLDAFSGTLGGVEREVVDSIVGSWRKVSSRVRPPDALGVLETRLLSVAIIRDEPGGSFGLFNDWRLAAAAAGAVENAEPAIARTILKVFLRCVAHARPEASSNALRELKKLVHRGKLDSRQIIAVSDELCQAAKGHQVADIVKAFSWFAPNDACAVEWLKGHWERAITDEQVDIETQAACALAHRGHAEEDHWETIYARLCEVHPPDPVLGVVRRFPNERWVEPLRTLLRSTENNGLLWPLTGAWAEQSTVYDPDEIIAEMARSVDPRVIDHLLIRGDILQRIDSPGVVDLLLEQLGRASDPRTDGRTHRALDRLNDVWLPRAVAGFDGASDRVDDTAREVLATLVRADTGDSGYLQTYPSLLKEAACGAAARLNLPGLPEWLLDTLGDSKPFVASHAADLLGWWQAEEAVKVLTDVLQRVDTDSPDMVHGFATAKALSRIGGADAVEALLDWPGTRIFGERYYDMLGDAVTDLDAVSACTSRLSQAKAEAEDEVLAAAAAGVNDWAWLDWYTRKRDGARPAKEDVDRVRDKICAILSGPEVRDERAWCSLINTLGALGPSEQSLHVLRRYVDMGSNDLKASAITAAAWSGQCLDGDSLELARKIDAGTLNWVNRDVLTSVVCALLNHDAETVNALRPEEVESVSLILMSDYRFDDLEKFAMRHPERVRKVIATQVDQKLLSSQSDNALNAAAVRFASEALAERFQTEDCTEWCEPNVLSFAVELRCCRDSKSGLQCELIEAALEFLCEALTYPNVRVREAAAGTLITLDQQAFSERVGRLMDSEDWRDRVAATEACGLLKQEEGEDILSRAWKDFDSRIRSTMHWVKERTREREGQDVALTAVERSHDVPTAFRWKQSLIHAADDWGLHRVTEIIRDPGTTPAKANWLKTVHEDMKQEWEKRTDDRNREIKREE